MENQFVKPHLNTSGFTLFEVIVSFTVFTTALMVAIGVYISILDLRQKGSAAQTTQQTTRKIMEDISRDIRISSFVEIDSVTTRITMQNSEFTDSTISYYLSGDDIYREICYTSSGCSSVLLNPSNIFFTQFSLEEHDNGGREFIKVSLTARHGDNTLAQTDEQYYEYKLSTTVTTRQ